MPLCKVHMYIMKQIALKKKKIKPMQAESRRRWISEGLLLLSDDPMSHASFSFSMFPSPLRTFFFFFN